jgi:hypothetical protein
MDKEQIRKSITEIREVMDRKVDIANPQGVLEKLNDLSNYLGLSSELIAQSGRIYNEKIGVLIKSLKGETATDKKLILAGMASDEIYIMELCQATNKDAHYVCESLRTMVSYLKTELQNIH